MTKKARIINQLDSLSASEKEAVIAFFNEHPVYENRVDWNDKSLVYTDFENVFALAKTSGKRQKRKAKTNPETLFDKYNCRIVSRTEEYVIVMPLDWECAVFLNSYGCGGTGAKWCIGDKNTFDNWNLYISAQKVFYFIIFNKKHSTYGKKIILQFDRFNAKLIAWNEHNEIIDLPKKNGSKKVFSFFKMLTALYYSFRKALNWAHSINSLEVINHSIKNSVEKDITSFQSKDLPKIVDISAFCPSNYTSSPDLLLLELGFDLIPLVDNDKGAELLERIQNMRRQIALELGFITPTIRIVDNMLLKSSEYCFKIHGVDAGKSTLKMGHYLCINPGSVKEEIAGEKTTEPAFGIPALWIAEDKRDEAKQAGYTVVDPPSVIATHLTEIIKRHAVELLGRQETQKLLDELRKDYPALVAEVCSGRNGKGTGLGTIQKVLQGLLREQVSIRNMVFILESIADSALLNTDTRFLIEKARQALANQLCRQYADEKHTLHVLTLEPSLEQKIIDSKAQNSSGDIFSALEPDIYNTWIKSLEKSVRTMKAEGYVPVILCSEQARYLVRTALERELPEAAVLSSAEITRDYKIEQIGVIALEGAL